MSRAPRVILHVDMDAFFASVAQLDDARLRGKPVVVGGHSLRRGVVSSASYEARAFGVRSAMPLYQALERCPKAVVVPADMPRYREIHRQLRAVWGRYSPLVEVASFDEAYLDLTGTEALLGPPREVARALQKAVLDETGLTCSVGVGANKLVAKVASKRYKPHGLCVVPPGDEASWLAGLPLTDLHGLGPKTAAKLHAIGVHRVDQLLAVPEAELTRYMGPLGHHLARMARGEDDRPVTPESPSKSHGAETTFRHDLVEPERLKAVMLDLVQEVAFRLRQDGVLARTVTIKIRYDDFETITRARTLAEATDDDLALGEAARDLLARHAQPGRPVRLLGVQATSLTTLAQLSWLGAQKREERQRLNQALDRLRDRHGLWVVSRASHLERSQG